MQHIIKKIKTVTKRYTTKSGVKESVSKRVDIGVTDLFDDGDIVAVILKTDFDKLNDDSDEIIADKDATIVELNESIDKYKAELESKTNIIGELSKEIKALKNTVAELESDVSTKDETIGKLSKDVDDKDAELSASGNTIDGLNVEVDELTATVGELKPLLLSKDSTINDLEKQIAIYDAVDVDKLKEKADELDKYKNVVIFQQKQITEYIQLVNFHKEKCAAYKNQSWYSKAFGRDAAVDILLPVLNLIDSSGNPISNDEDATDDVTPDDDSGKSTTKDNIKII